MFVGGELGQNAPQNVGLKQIVEDDVRERLRAAIAVGEGAAESAALLCVQREIAVVRKHVQHQIIL